MTRHHVDRGRANAPDAVTHQALFRFPPKSVFQVLTDPTLLEEVSRWKVTPPARFEQGATWSERRRLRTRVWTVTSFDRRGLSFTVEGSGVRVTFTAKKGGPGSCNAHLHITGPPRAVARFDRSDGDRLRRLGAWLEGDD